MPSIVTRLRRITSGATWIPEIDGLRFVAVLSVVLFHIGAQVSSKSGVQWTTLAWYAPLTRCLWNGARGVELFFVISGFILGRPFARQYLLGEKPASLGRYYLRRLTRLEPPYLLNLILCAGAVMLYLHTSALEVTKHFLASAIYCHDLIYRAPSTLNSVTWSLEIEIQFYLLVPLLVLVYRIRRALVRRGLLIAAMLGLSYFQQWFFLQALWFRPAGILYSTVLFYLQYFLAGLLLTDLYLTAMPSWRPSRWWDLASLLCWPAYFYYDYTWPPTIMPFLILAVCLGAFRGVYCPRFFRLKPIALIGGMCYSIYLWHFFIIAFVFKASRHLVFTHDYLANFLLQAVVLVPPVLFLSTLYYLAIERPCMDPAWPQKLFGKRKAVPADSETA